MGQFEFSFDIQLDKNKRWVCKNKGFLFFVIQNSFSWQRSWPALFTNWGFGEPSNAPTDTCVKAKNGLWNASDCTTSTGYVCEINSGKQTKI